MVKINKVFGIGLSRTGTTSLSEALNRLEIHTLHWPNDDQTFRELASGNFRLSVLEEYDGIVDIPISTFYPQFDKAYRGSKFILTTRGIDSWLGSARRHFAAGAPGLNSRGGEIASMTFSSYCRAVTYGVLEFNEERFRHVYSAHLRDVELYFEKRPDDLLKLDVSSSDSWKNLCAFLGKPIPTEGFPTKNSLADRVHWDDQLEEAINELKGMIGRSSPFVLAGEAARVFAKDHWVSVLPITEKGGHYWGPPGQGMSAIDEVERLRRMGAEYLVIVFSAFWWLDYYEGLDHHLRSAYKCSLENERVVVFDLRNS